MGETAARQALREKSVAVSAAITRSLELILQYLVQISFITQHQKDEIVSIGQVAPSHKAGRALSAIEAKVDSGNDPLRGSRYLKSFLEILRRQDVGEYDLAKDIATLYVKYAEKGSEEYDFFENVANDGDQGAGCDQVPHPVASLPSSPPPAAAVATLLPRRSGKLNIDRDVRKVKGCLKNLNKDELKDLFQELGLKYSTVQNNYEGSTRDSYSESLIQDWILEKDDVLMLTDYKGGATWENLKKALKELNHHGVANQYQC